MSQAIEVPTPAPSTIEAKRLCRRPPSLAAGSIGPTPSVSRCITRWRCSHFGPGSSVGRGLDSALAGTYVFGTLGINLCYHRLLTHRSFDCPKWLEHCLCRSSASVACKTRRPAGSASTACTISIPMSSPIRTARWSPSSGAHVGWLLVRESRTLAYATLRALCQGSPARPVLHEPRTPIPVGLDQPRAMGSLFRRRVLDRLGRQRAAIGRSQYSSA